jgi:lysophospholipase L1-like esterase
MAVPGGGDGAAPAEASLSSTGADTRPIYLALGDSIAFGFDPFVDAAVPDAFVGYPARVAAGLSRVMVNASCPGETSAGFVAADGIDNGCRGFRAKYPLHVAYSGTQLAFATEFLRSHPTTNVVSLGIGVNDLLHCIRATADRCAQELSATLAAYRADLTTILRGLREVYDGELVLVGYYSPDYQNLRLTAAVTRLDAVMTDLARTYQAKVADAFTAFAVSGLGDAGDICGAGLLIRSRHGCDIHPSPAGRDLLAATVIRTVRSAGPGGVKPGTPYGAA